MKFGKGMILLVLVICMCVSCGGETTDYLAYQDIGFSAYVRFTVDGREETNAVVEICPLVTDGETAETGEDSADDGLLSGRKGSFTLDGGILNGVTFLFDGGRAYLSSGKLKIAVSDTNLISGVTDMMSLFVLRRGDFSGGTKDENGNVNVTYCYNQPNGNPVTVVVTLGEEMLPVRISADLADKTIDAVIVSMTLTANTEE